MEIRYFAILAFVAIVAAVYRIWLRQYLRDPLAALADRRLHADMASPRPTIVWNSPGTAADNPEQRIEKDISDFTKSTLFLTLDFISEVISLATFSVIF